MHHEWVAVAFFIGFITPMMGHFIGTGIGAAIKNAIQRPKTYHSWYGRLTGRYRNHLVIIMIIWAVGIGLMTPFISAGYTRPDDPIRIAFGGAGAAGALAAGSLLMFIPKKYAITSRGIYVSGIAAKIIPWSDIIHYEIRKNEKVMVLERTVGRSAGTDYIPLANDVDKIEKALTDAQNG